MKAIKTFWRILLGKQLTCAQLVVSYPSNESPRKIINELTKKIKQMEKEIFTNGENQ